MIPQIPKFHGKYIILIMIICKVSMFVSIHADIKWNNIRTVNFICLDSL